MMVVKIKKQKTQKKCAIKQNLKFKDYKRCLEANQTENKINLKKRIILKSIIIKNLQKSTE